jgi:hypothetical protein
LLTDKGHLCKKSGLTRKFLDLLSDCSKTAGYKVAYKSQSLSYISNGEMEYETKIHNIIYVSSPLNESLTYKSKKICTKGKVQNFREHVQRTNRWRTITCG